MSLGPFRSAVLALFLPVFSAQNVWAHACLLPTGSIPPRDNSCGLKLGPCGGLVRSANPKVLAAGQQLTIQFQETIDHPGWYRVAFAPAADTGFDENILLDNIPDTQGGTLPHNYGVTITVPNTPCTDCTLQLIQYMTENPAMPTKYFSCADVIIQPAGGASPTPSPSPSSSPVPSASSGPTECP